MRSLPRARDPPLGGAQRVQCGPSVADATAASSLSRRRRSVCSSGASRALPHQALPQQPQHTSGLPGVVAGVPVAPGASEHVTAASWAPRTRKLRARNLTLDNQGGYMILDPHTNTIVAGERYDLSLDDVERQVAAG